MAKSFWEKVNEKMSIKWISITTTFIVVGTILSFGYGAGNYLSEINSAQRVLEITESYQEKIFEHRQTCNYTKIYNLEEKTNNIELTVDQLKNSK